MAEQISVGVIGTGNMGAHHARNYHEMTETNLTGISDVNENAKELAEKYNAKYYPNFLDMLEQEKLDAVSIAVPTNLHYSIGKIALEKSIHVLLEKPITRTLTEADELIDLAHEKDLILSVGHIERYNPVISEAKKFIKAGKLGKITSVISQRLGGFPQKQPSTDVILDLAIHDIDIMNYLLEKPGEILASHGSRTFHTVDIDSAEILMNYNGVSGFIQANWITPVKIRRLAITGSLGYLEADYITQQLTYYERINIEAKQDFDAFVSSFGTPEKHVSKPGVQEPLRNELKSFISAINGLEPEELVRPEEARIALEIAMSALKKIKVGSKNE